MCAAPTEVEHDTALGPADLGMPHATVVPRPAPSSEYAVVGFLQGLAGDRTRWPAGRAAMTRLLRAARITAVGHVAAVEDGALTGELCS